MSKRNEDILITALFCGFLAVMLVCYLVMPHQAFSETEKRYLAEKPALTWENLLCGQLGDDIESYMADHIPGRNFFVGLNAWANLVSGRQVTGDIRLLEGNRLAEAPIERNTEQILKNMDTIQGFCAAVDQDVQLMLVPSAGWAAQSPRKTFLDLFSREEYRDDEIIADIYALAGEEVTTVDVSELLLGLEGAYFRTDHHWTSRGAYRVYAALMEQKGRDFPDEDAFLVETVEGFYGSTYSRSALWSIPSESLELWHSQTRLLVENAEEPGIHEGVFYRNRLEEADKYTVYLDGNHSLVRIENPAMAGKGKLLVVRDSYSNLLGTFLAESYETVILVDLRYYKNPISQLATQEGCDEILIVYSLGNFMTDANIIWLR